MFICVWVKILKSAVLAHPQDILSIASHTPIQLACFVMPAPKQTPPTHWPAQEPKQGAEKKSSTPKTSPFMLKVGRQPPPPPQTPPPEWPQSGRPGATPGGTKPAGSSTDQCDDTPWKPAGAVPASRPKAPVSEESRRRTESGSAHVQGDSQLQRE